MEHTATLLSDGRVLVTGGQSAGDGNDNFVEKAAEIYDPGTGTWTLVDSMSRARYGHTATLLPDGTVLIAGGAGPRGRSSVYRSIRGIQSILRTVEKCQFDHHSAGISHGGAPEQWECISGRRLDFACQ